MEVCGVEMLKLNELRKKICIFVITILSAQCAGIWIKDIITLIIGILHQLI